MSKGDRAAGLARWLGGIAGRLVRAYRVLPHEGRLAVFAAIGLFVTLFLPWYQETVIVPRGTNVQSATATLTGWGAFSFVEAAVLLVSLGVLTLLVQRAEGKAFHLPGGDGSVIMVAGGWTCLLVVWRIFDKQGTTGRGQYATTSGIEWGIFVALATAAFMAYAGSRIRAAHQPEPPLPGDEGAPLPGRPGESGSIPASARAPASAPAPAAPGRGSGGSAGRRVRSESDFTPGAPARPQGWLSARPEPAGEREPPRSARREPAGEHEPPASAPREPRPGQRRPFRAPGQEPAASSGPETEATRAGGAKRGDPPARDADRPGQAPLPPSTAAARRRQRPDEQLTTPLERED
jgi:hypothetical protein